VSTTSAVSLGLQANTPCRFRSREYSTEDEPWDPISAVTSALLGDIGSIGMAVADFPRDVFKAARGPKSKTPDSSETPDADPAKTPATDTTGTTATPADSTANPADAASAVSGADTTGVTSGMDLAPSTSAASADSAATATSQERPATPPHTRSESSASQKPGPASPSNMNENMERAMGAGKSINNIVSTGVKTPMNFCLGLARGFRNAPKLYNDDTVRKPEKVNSFESGLRVAGKEFGLGFYDGISGLVTQPLRGAQKEGGLGFLKGVGKGIGGLVLKPAAGKLLLNGSLENNTADSFSPSPQLSGLYRLTQWLAYMPRSEACSLRVLRIILWHLAYHRATWISVILRPGNVKTLKHVGFP
jgi:hypothetical protein